ncbi:MAG: putative bifunctional diguanylate cyclase/phosphodiesterase [Ilumatobacter sp.]|uniref:putative bifunctional diguanylate cyclase/phosphodiesterase n=1 Tax=Ilumatobacter sp. TaxID=1967498 RepID=UPI00391CAD7D
MTSPSAPPGWAVPAVYALAAAIAVAAVGLTATTPNLGAAAFDSPWWLIFPIGMGYFLAERFPFTIEFRRETIAFSLTEVPTVFALAFLGPIPAMTARIAFALAAMLSRRRPPRFKLVFNAAMFAFESALAFAVVRRLSGATEPDAGSFMLAAAASVTIATLAGYLAISIVVAFFAGDFRTRFQAEVLTSMATAGTGALIGAVAVAPALFGLQYAALSILPIVAAWVSLRRHGTLSQAHRDLTDLHSFSTILDQSLHLDDLAPRALDEIARLVHAERVTLRLTNTAGDQLFSHGAPIDVDEVPASRRGAFLPDDEIVAGSSLARCGSFIVPIVADDNFLGVIAVAGRSQGAFSFDESDVSRATDLAEQLGSSIRNGLLHASVEHAATHDALTGEPNRSAFEARLRREIAADHSTHLAVIVLDLNQFKEVNDTLGHHVGDQVLVEFARRVRSVLDDDDMLSRFGGDEFAILIRRANVDEVRQLAERILSMSYTPLRLDGCDAVVTSSIGITFVGSETLPASILRRADIAMYAAKNQRIGIEVYREEIDRRTPARLSLLGDLRSAIERDRLEVHFQPKVELATSRVIGAEALVRWQHPDRGWVAPDDFIGVAEDSGLIRLVTDVVLTKSIEQATLWQRLGYDLDVAVNLSALDLHDEDLARRIDAKLSDHGLDASRLILEITESALMVDTDRTMGTIDQLDRLGVRLSLDDFGTGYSSLSYLRRLPVAELKIDRSFVSDLLLNVNDDVIVRSTIDLGHNLGLRIVAEGIENMQVYDRLAALGCDTGQGYGIARPLAPESFAQWLETTTHDVARQPVNVIRLRRNPA